MSSCGWTLNHELDVAHCAAGPWSLSMACSRASCSDFRYNVPCLSHSRTKAGRLVEFSPDWGFSTLESATCGMQNRTFGLSRKSILCCVWWFLRPKKPPIIMHLTFSLGRFCIPHVADSNVEKPESGENSTRRPALAFYTCINALAMLKTRLGRREETELAR